MWGDGQKIAEQPNYYHKIMILNIQVLVIWLLLLCTLFIVINYIFNIHWEIFHKYSGLKQMSNYFNRIYKKYILDRFLSFTDFA